MALFFGLYLATNVRNFTFPWNLRETSILNLPAGFTNGI